jgi:hypothetical protein
MWIAVTRDGLSISRLAETPHNIDDDIVFGRPSCSWVVSRPHDGGYANLFHRGIPSSLSGSDHRCARDIYQSWVLHRGMDRACIHVDISSPLLIGASASDSVVILPRAPSSHGGSPSQSSSYGLLVFLQDRSTVRSYFQTKNIQHRL